MRSKINGANRISILGRTKYQRSVFAIMAWFAGSASMGSAVAQTTAVNSAPAAGDTGQLQEIIVTAEKRSTNLQTTPIAVTALSADTLQQNQIRDLKDIVSLVPNFRMGDAQGIAQITIRGIGSSTFLPGYEGAVAVNQNDVYISRSIAQQAGVFDVSSIEVLRGPQGTLFGRNATAGAVDITTAQPTPKLSGYLRQSVGNYGESRTDVAISGPIDDDRLMVRIAAFRETHDGYGSNIVTAIDIDDKNDYGVRGTLLFKPSDNFSATLIAEYFNENDHGGGFHYLGAAGLSGIPGALGVPPAFQTTGGYTASNVRDIADGPGSGPLFELQTRAVTGIMAWNNEDAFSIKSITGYRDQDAHFTYNAFGGYSTIANGFEVSGEPADQVSQELQAHYDTSNLHLTGGGYYFHEKDDVTPQNIVNSTAFLTDALGIPYPTPGYIRLAVLAGELSTDAYAGFAQGTYSLTPELSLTAGVRYSVETKRAAEQYVVSPFTYYPTSSPPPPAVPLPPVTFDATTPRFGIQYQVDPQTLLYASYSQGFKSGGYDTAIENPKPFLPEKLTDYEIGIKTTQLDNRLRANLSGFYYDYTNLQVQQVVGFSVQTGNAAAARDYGMEAEVTYLVTSALELHGFGAWTHARYGKYCGPDPALPNVVTPTSCPLIGGVLPANEANFNGNTLDNAPDYQATVAAQYTWNLPVGTFVARGEAEYSSRFFFGPGNEALLSQAAYVKGNLFATYRPISEWEVTAYGRNIGNTTTRTSALVAATLVGNPVIGSLAPPRLFGLEVQYKF